MRTRRISPFLTAVALILAALLAGCTATQSTGASRVAAINHIVFMKLKNPARAEALITDCDAMLATIPGVARYGCGRHIETGRDSVIDDYDVGAVIGFDTAEAYAAYVEHPNHVELVQRWQPHLEWLKVYDVHDPTP